MGGFTYNGFKLNITDFPSVFNFLKEVKKEFELYKKSEICRHIAHLTIDNIDNYILKENNIRNIFGFKNKDVAFALETMNNIPTLSLPPHLRCFLEDITNIYQNYNIRLNADSPISLAWWQLKTMLDTEKTPYNVADSVDLSMSLYLFEKDNQFYLQLPIKDIKDAKNILLSFPVIEDYSYNSDYEDYTDANEREERFKLWRGLSEKSLNEGLEYHLTNNDLYYHPKAEELEKFIISKEDRAKRLSKNITNIIPPKDLKQSEIISFILDYQSGDEYKTRLQENYELLLTVLPDIDVSNITQEYECFLEKNDFKY